NVTRVLVFCVSAFLAGVAGALFIAAPGQASGVGFGSFSSLIWLAVLGLTGLRRLASPLLAAALLAVAPAYASGFLTAEKQSMAFGALAVGVAVLGGGRIAWRPNVALRGSRRRAESPPARRELTPAAVA
ncbi:MAG: branched-chain amino acid ABC transporter permease/ATP-binding protein, partial [Solirubrobacteraceae bacterium]